MPGDYHNIRNYIKGHSIKKVKNQWSRLLWIKPAKLGGMVAHSHPLGGWTKAFYSHREEQQEVTLSSLAFFLSACQGPLLRRACPPNQSSMRLETQNREVPSNALCLPCNTAPLPTAPACTDAMDTPASMGIIRCGVIACLWGFTVGTERLYVPFSC